MSQHTCSKLKGRASSDEKAHHAEPERHSEQQIKDCLHTYPGNFRISNAGNLPEMGHSLYWPITLVKSAGGMPRGDYQWYQKAECNKGSARIGQPVENSTDLRDLNTRRINLRTAQQ